MKLPKALFTYRRSPYYIVEICWVIAIVAMILSVTTQKVSIVKSIFIIIPIMLMTYFVAEGIEQIRPLLREKQWRKAIIRILPYALGLITGTITIGAAIAML